MKHLNRLTLLQIVAALVLALLLAWQLASLAAMKGYLTSGLQARLAQVASLAAQGLKTRFDAAVQEQLDAGLLALPPHKLHRDSLPSVSRQFARLSAQLNPVKSWLVVLPAATPGKTIELWKYEAPGSYFRSQNPEGSWITDESLSNRIEQLIPVTGQKRSVWGAGYWETAVDSSLRFLYHTGNRDESMLLGFPIFDTVYFDTAYFDFDKEVRPLGFLFMQINLWYVSYPIAREYLNQEFWEEHAGMIDFGKHHIDFDLRDSEGRELLSLGREELLQKQFEAYYSPGYARSLPVKIHPPGGFSRRYLAATGCVHLPAKPVPRDRYVCRIGPDALGDLSQHPQIGAALAAQIRFSRPGLA